MNSAQVVFQVVVLITNAHLFFTQPLGTDSKVIIVDNKLLVTFDKMNLDFRGIRENAEFEELWGQKQGKIKFLGTVLHTFDVFVKPFDCVGYRRKNPAKKIFTGSVFF